MPKRPKGPPFTAKRPADLLDKVYAYHGWVRKAGESRSKRVADLYNISVDWRTNTVTATPKEE